MDFRAILDTLNSLGLVRGDRVLVMSSMAALGDIEGGAEGIIDALLAAVGEEGLIAMPTYDTALPFDSKTSESCLDELADAFWRRPEAFRSKHPTHSLAAIGAGAQELVRGHEKLPTAFGEGTPYHKLAQAGGKILLLGVGQERNILLHTAESLAQLPYLKKTSAAYIDDEGRQVTVNVSDVDRTHRDFLSFDSIFRDLGIMSVEKMDRAVCRLLDASETLQTALDVLEEDPTAALCNNPQCAECAESRGEIKRARIRDESFVLAARASDISEYWEEILAAIRSEGIDALELTATEYLRFGAQIERENIQIVSICASVTDDLGVAAARKLGVPITMLVGSKSAYDVACETDASGVKTLMINAGMMASFYYELMENSQVQVGVAFNPAQFAKAGEQPFVHVFERGKIRKYVELFYVDDGTFESFPTLPGQGNAEVKEILSALRCSGFSGPVVLRSHSAGAAEFRKTAEAFWELLDSM